MRLDARRNDSPIAFQSHPPERRRRPANVAACCCCCCCCCLHSLGGLIGAAAAGRSKSLEEYRATKAYWLGLAALLLVTCVWSGLASGDLTEAMLAVALLLPGYQLASSLIAGVIALITVGPAGLPRVWRLTWRGFLGAVIGLLIMLIPVLLMNRN